MGERKTALITGASGGIGGAAAVAFAKEGYNVVLHYNSSEQKANDVLQKVLECGVEAHIFKADISVYAQAGELVKFTLDTFGSIDALVNNAGITKDTLLLRMREEDFDRVIEVNLKGAFNMTSHAARSMLKKRSGSIVNISSVVGIRGQCCAGKLRKRKSRSYWYDESLRKGNGAKGHPRQRCCTGFCRNGNDGGFNGRNKENNA